MEVRKEPLMNSSDPDFPLMNAESFLDCMGGEPSLCVMILETALREGDEQIAEIQTLTERSDKQATARVLHSLRGGSATFGAKSLGALSQLMESECNQHGVAAVLPHLSAFEGESVAYRRALECLLAELRVLI